MFDQNKIKKIYAAFFVSEMVKIRFVLQEFDRFTASTNTDILTRNNNVPQRK